jgi:hypothetical protein
MCSLHPQIEHHVIRERRVRPERMVYGADHRAGSRLGKFPRPPAAKYYTQYCCVALVLSLVYLAEGSSAALHQFFDCHHTLIVIIINMLMPVKQNSWYLV